MRQPLCRSSSLSVVQESGKPWDVAIIGGGASGLGAAVDAASRGFRTVLVEQGDFGKGTSSRSTKLIHGGFRYLKQGDLSLVKESLHERALLLRNAPHLVKPLSFVVPTYRWWERLYYGIGLKVYDRLAGSEGVGRSRFLSRRDTLEHLNGLSPDGLHGGVFYYDAQFDDSRLAMTLAQTAVNQGGLVLNYARVENFLKEEDQVCGLVVRDLESNAAFEIRARSVINATGVFTDEMRHLDDEQASPVMQLSQGIHVVLDAGVLGGETAMMIPKTDDGRILFAIPWMGKVVLGTTDTPVKSAEIEPLPLESEIDFLLEHASRYLARSVSRKDVRSVFAGIRPLVSDADKKETSSISRKHRILVSKSGLVTIAGGKWTTYRKMAEDVVNKAIEVSGLVERPCKTSQLRLHGGDSSEGDSAKWAAYGVDSQFLDELVALHPEWDRIIHPQLPIREVEVVWAVRYEMARTVEDVLSRRTRALLLDANASIQAAPEVAKIMSLELNQDEIWIEEQIRCFSKLAQNYCVNISQSPSPGHKAP
ncbi:glycerol-3-phosphate dehydrogenase/oxidase [bacterium]|jgi:glycerol-3-phosphate dehydrogenase|nr:glycerol-3-phosphate dehydrogenase/oxidase [Verrucomicrobiota bacterium]MDA7632536.1 glycerol-3-phosphate dehydrogenase/oxidase [bacterium]MDA7867343.1 glycerol-3-phosphate dehydrogenase/oxidase [Verrucomicrobiota bacterium]MDB4798093.1 glycerol-3-phosphate dehydrogenase/oxidase [Verrucomicrobiota bacterium]